MLVTGGLGGLGLIASFQCAAEFENPIITTSRSGRLGSGGPSSMNIFEAMKELVPVYNVKLDVGNSKDVADVFAWASRPSMPAADRSIMIDDIIYQLKYKMNRLPDDALRALLELLLETKDKLHEIMYDLRSRETKVDPSVIMDLAEKEAGVSDMIGRLRARVGHVERTGRCTVVGGVVPGNYALSEGDEYGFRNYMPLADQQSEPVSKETLLALMQEEMHSKELANSPEEAPAEGLLSGSALSKMMQEELSEMKYALPAMNTMDGNPERSAIG